MRIVVLGQDNAIKYREGLDDLVKTGHDLPSAQIQIAQWGFTELELVASINGVSVRYASGVDNFGLYRGGTGQDTDDAGLSEALEDCKEFVKRGSSTRWVSTCYESLDKLVEDAKRIMAKVGR